MNTTSSSEDEDPLQEARAYNRSIYLMVSMPYLLFGAISFAIYRGMRAADRRNRTDALEIDTPERITPPTERPAEVDADERL